MKKMIWNRVIWGDKAFNALAIMSDFNRLAA